MTVTRISAVIFCNILNMNVIRFLNLDLAALTHVFVTCSPSESSGQDEDLRKYSLYNNDLGIPQSSNPRRFGFCSFGMTRNFLNILGRSGGPPGRNSFRMKTSIRRSTASSLEPLTPEPVIPNSGNHSFTGLDLPVHRLTEEGSV